MDRFSQLQFAIGWMALALQACVAIVMVRRKLVRELPFFFAYTAYHVAQYCVETIAYKRSYAAYFYTYWATEIFDALLVLLVLQEVFGQVFRPYEALRSVGVALFRVGLLLLVVASIVIASGTPRVMQYSDRVNAFFAVQRSTLFVQAGLILFLILSSRFFGLGWRNHLFGISLGFGGMACVSGLGSALAPLMPPPLNDWFVQSIAYGFIVGIVVWFCYFIAPWSSSQVDRAQIDASPLKGWNRALDGMLNRQ
jgi:hypothetical protein